MMSEYACMSVFIPGGGFPVLRLCRLLAAGFKGTHCHSWHVLVHQDLLVLYFLTCMANKCNLFNSLEMKVMSYP